MRFPLRVFFLYTRANQASLDQLNAYLSPLVREGLLQAWAPQDIRPVEEQSDSLHRNLSRSDFVLALLSPELLDAPWMLDEQVKEAIRRFLMGKLRLMPILVSPCLWRYSPLFRNVPAEPWPEGPLPQAVNTPYWKSPEHAWAQVVRGLKRHLQRLQCPEFTPPDTVRVQGGRFNMGCKKYSEESPVREVTVPDFHMSRYPITLAQFRQFIEASGYVTDADRYGYSFLEALPPIEPVTGVNWRCNTASFAHPEHEYDHPVTHVSWNDARAYCAWLSQKTGQTWRLPSEAEWEYAARGGQQGAADHYPYAGSHSLEEVAWYAENSNEQTQPVGQKKPNSLGLYDMSGNVWEWCLDCWSNNLVCIPTNGSPKDAKNCKERVLRGGAWCSGPYACRVSMRSRYGPHFHTDATGFRVALTTA